MTFAYATGAIVQCGISPQRKSVVDVCSSCICSAVLYRESWCRLDVLQPFRQQQRLQSMTWDHRIAKVAPLAALAIAAFATIVTFAAYYQ